jgi:predicted phage tail protein
VNQSGTISKPQRLLEVPQPAQPHDLEKIIAGSNGAANVPLRWLRPQNGMPAYYRVEVATSPFFVPEGKVIERDQLISTQFSANDLRPGAYFWRVRATAATGQTSDWSEPKKFIVSSPSNGSGSVVVTRLSANYLGGDLYIIRGTSAAGTTISVAGGRETIVGPDGNFQIQVSANATVREVTIMAFDPQGNRSQYRLPLTRSG